MQMTRVQIKATGQVLDMIPSVAKRMIAGGTAEEYKPKAIESQVVAPRAERAVATAQAGPTKKTRKSA